MKEWSPGAPIQPNTIWIDLLQPTSEQEAAVEKLLGIKVPTHEEMKEIELSNRLYQEGESLVMTASLLSKVNTGMPVTHPVTFLLAQKILVTVRYVDTTSFQRFIARVEKGRIEPSGISYLLTALDTIVNREADILEVLDRDIDAITKIIFPIQEEENRADYKQILGRIGRCGDLASKTHESLITLSRVAGFLTHYPQILPKKGQNELISLQKDIAGLSEHGTYLTGKVNFILDATLGMINIEQNNVFRVLSVASLVFLPPTLIAGMYGMNFHDMPELGWPYGYPMAIMLMLLAAIAPYTILKRRKLL